MNSRAARGGVLVIDDSGDRKDGVKAAHMGHQWLGRYGKTDNGVALAEIDHRPR